MMNATIITLVTKEWANFQEVHNKGGRAPCQNDYRTFAMMRTSQFSTWSEELCASYLADLERAEKEGRNLLTEKYAYMMERTAPDDYENMKHLLPVVSDAKKAMINQIVDIQLQWQSEYIKLYPKFSRGGRPMDANGDTSYYTSFETYLRSELMTYSDHTVSLYLAHVQKLYAQGINMTIENLECNAKLYGFSSLDEMENLTK